MVWAGPGDKGALWAPTLLFIGRFLAQTPIENWGELKSK